MSHKELEFLPCLVESDQVESMKRKDSKALEIPGNLET